MERFCFTFGQNHAHRLHGVTLDRDAVVEITAVDGDAARAIMFEEFGPKWSMQYPADGFDMKHFPRGVVLRLPRVTP